MNRRRLRRWRGRALFFGLSLALWSSAQTEGGPWQVEPLEPVSPRRTLKSTEELRQELKRRPLDVELARARIQEGEAKESEARSRILPTLGLSSSVNQHLLLRQAPALDASESPPVEVMRTSPDPATTLDGTLTATLPLLSPRSLYEWSTSSRQLESAEAAEKNAHRLVLGRALDALLGARSARQLAQVSRASFRAALAVLSLTEEQLRGGLGTFVDVVRAKQEVLEARTQIILVDERLRRALETLGLALGSAEPVGVSDALGETELLGLLEQVCATVDQISARPDVEAARREVALHQAKAEAVDYGYLPELRMSSALKLWSSRDLTPNQLPVTWTAMAELSMPIFDGGVRAAEKARLTAQLEQARAQARETSRQASVDSERAERAILVAEESSRIAEQTYELSVVTLELLKERFAIGEVTSFELIQQVRRIRETDADRTVKRFDLIKARLGARIAHASCAL